MTNRRTARMWISQIAHDFDEQDATLRAGDPLGFPGYPEQLALAQVESGLNEACIWGWAVIGEQRCALVCMDFSFLGGSMGIVVGEKVARAFDAARRTRACVVTVTSSGGARMQEGMLALAQMAKTAEARARHARAGLGHVTLLTSPTTGGVYASFASLADVILAEEDATLGFAGPRVVAELTGEVPSPEMHTAAFAFEHGLIDAIVTPAEAGETIACALSGLARGAAEPPATRAPDLPGRPVLTTRSAWERMQLARHPSRPKGPAILDQLLRDAFELHGDRMGSDDPSIRVRLGAIGPTRVLAIAQDSSGDRRITPSGFWKAIRTLRLAARFDLPVVTVIDTRGADPGPASEAAGVARAIAYTFVSLLECPSPTLAVLVGEGGSGGALAMAACDRLLACENAVFSVIAPEAAAAILYREPSKAPELAESLRITAEDLVELGLADRVVPDPVAGDLEALTGAITAELNQLLAVRPRSRIRRRNRRWREAGNRYIQQAGT